MADNVALPPSSVTAAADEVTWSGDTAKVQIVELATVTGAEGAKTPVLVPAGGGTEAAALRVTLASDSTGLVSVDDNGASLTIDAPVGTPAFVRLSDGAAAITTLPVSLASVPSHAVVSAGDVAHDTADSGLPAKVGAKAIAGLSTATLVAAADRTDLYAGTDGALIVRPYGGMEDIVSGRASNTDGTSHSVIAAGGAGIIHNITSIIIVNTSTAAIYADILDGASIKATVPVPAQGGATVNLPVPLRGTANTAWNCDPSAATTTVYTTLVGFKSKV